MGIIKSSSNLISAVIDSVVMLNKFQNFLCFVEILRQFLELSSKVVFGLPVFLFPLRLPCTLFSSLQYTENYTATFYLPTAQARLLASCNYRK